MNRTLALVILMLLCHVCSAQSSTDRLLDQLDSLLANRIAFDNAKIQRLAHFKNKLALVKGDEQFALLEDIYDEYKSFIYDSAFSYAMRLQGIARQSGDPTKIATAKIKMAFVLVSSGLLNEALDSLMTIEVTGVPADVRIRYYYLMVRTCYDLADFAQNHFYGKQYAGLGRAYVDSASLLMPPNSVEYLVVNGLKSLHQREMTQAKFYYEDVIENYKLSDNQFAIAASTLSFIYMNTGELGQSKDMLIKAAIADARSNTKEAIALLKLADLLYREGDIEKAYEYIKLAMDDADFYGARYRKMQVAAIFPIIEGDRLLKVESRRQMLLLYSLVITLSVVVILSFIRAIKKRNKRLLNTQALLEESNKIKEEYLWYYFNTTADYIGKLDALKTSIENKLLNKRIDELRSTAESINIKSERNELFHNFDVVFLKLFPDFVNLFNSLLKMEHKIVLKEGQLLSMEMRIFALIRLGIHDHEKIAKILGYSLTTIYTYKTRIKAKASISSEDFDKRILSIPAI
jgi:tetratricopeptide (TPR) repeat protein